MNKLTRAVALALALAAAGAAKAQVYSPAYGVNGAPMSNFLANSFLAQQVANKALSASAYPQGPKRAAPSQSHAAAMEFRETGEPIAPKQLAQSYPPNAQPDAERTFREILEGYHKLESRFGIRRNDLSGAVAAFIAGSYTALRDEPFPDENFQPLVAQIRGAIEGLTPLMEASDREKQMLYENFAILGAYMAITREALAKSPNPELTRNMQAAARNYLSEVLHVDPERLKITRKGMTLS